MPPAGPGWDWLRLAGLSWDWLGLPTGAGGCLAWKPGALRHCHVLILFIQPSRLDKYMVAEIHLA